MKIVAISDTHHTDSESLAAITRKLPYEGGVLIHAGDATFTGGVNEWANWIPWWDSLNRRFAKRIFVPGNHDFNWNFWPYEKIEVIDGVKFGLMKLVPNLPDWANHGTEEMIWNALSKLGQVDVLVTHGPPRGIMDADAFNASHYGSTAMFDYVTGPNKPAVHIFGHVHESYGQERRTGVRFYNVSICTRQYKPDNPAVEIEI